MPLASLRDRRLTNRQIELKQQFVVFWLRQAWFAIPINSMRRAIPIEKDDIPTITQEGMAVPVIDFGEKLFPNQQLILHPSLNFGDIDVSSQRSLILVQGKSLLGILIDSQPVLQRISESEFVPILDIHKTEFNIEFIKFMTVPNAEYRPAIFLLDPNSV